MTHIFFAAFVLVGTLFQPSVSSAQVRIPGVTFPDPGCPVCGSGTPTCPWSYEEFCRRPPEDPSGPSSPRCTIDFPDYTDFTIFPNPPYPYCILLGTTTCPGSITYYWRCIAPTEPPPSDEEPPVCLDLETCERTPDVKYCRLDDKGCYQPVFEIQACPPGGNNTLECPCADGVVNSYCSLVDPEFCYAGSFFDGTGWGSFKDCDRKLKEGTFFGTCLINDRNCYGIPSDKPPEVLPPGQDGPPPGSEIQSLQPGQCALGFCCPVSVKYLTWNDVKNGNVSIGSMLKSIFLEEKDESCALFKDGNKVTIKTTTLTLGMLPLSPAKQFIRLTYKIGFDVERICGNLSNPSCFAAAIQTAIRAEKEGLPYHIFTVTGEMNGVRQAHALVMLEGPDGLYRFLSWGQSFKELDDFYFQARMYGYNIDAIIAVDDSIAKFIKGQLIYQVPREIPPFLLLPP